MKNPKIFCLSGLGANELAYSKIGALEFPKVMVPWLKSLPNENLNQYAIRLIEKHHISQNDILIGLSFGGLVCQEIAKKLRIKQLILISSFRDKEDLRPIFKYGLKSKIYRLMPDKKVGIIDELVANYLNSGSARSKPILKQMLNSTDFDLMRWSIQQIAISKHQELNDATTLNLLGNNDRIVKQWEMKHTKIIKGGSHFMIYDKGQEITNLINEFLINQMSRLETIR